MRLEGTRFGEIEIDETNAIELPRGLLGFASQRRFALLTRANGAGVAWLQSLDSPSLAFPVIEGDAFPYPQATLRAHAREAGIDDADLAVLVIVAAPRRKGALVANEIAPIVVDTKTRRGAQILLDHRRYSAKRAVVAAEAHLPVMEHAMASDAHSMTG
jgi:flagellar assembly factor FliW